MSQEHINSVAFNLAYGDGQEENVIESFEDDEGGWCDRLGPEVPARQVEAIRILMLDCIERNQVHDDLFHIIVDILRPYIVGMRDSLIERGGFSVEFVDENCKELGFAR